MGKTRKDSLGKFELSNDALGKIGKGKMKYGEKIIKLEGGQTDKYHYSP